MTKQLVLENKPVNSKWVDIFADMQTNSYESKNLLLLVGKILSMPCSDTFVEKIFSLMSSHCSDTRNQCNVGLRRAVLQVGVNFIFDCVQFYHYIKEKEDVLKTAQKSIIGKGDRKNKSIVLYHGTERNMSFCFFN